MKIADIILDGGTQPRQEMDNKVIQEYAEAMGRGDTFLKVIVFTDGDKYWLADGFHRVYAYKQRNQTEIDVDLRQGTLEDAQWYSFSANKANGLHRSNEDKQRAVRAALAHPKAAGKSGREIAEHCGVGEKMIRKYKDDPTAALPQSNLVTGRDGRTYDVTKLRERGKTTEIVDGGSGAVIETPQVVTKEEHEASMFTGESDAIHRANMAINNLNQIKQNDPQRVEGYKKVAQFISNNL